MPGRKLVDYKGRQAEAEIVDFESKAENWNQYALAERALAKDLANIAEVRHILTEKARGNLLVWIAIDRADSYEVRSRIYDKELALIDGFPEVNFDFNLVPAMGRNPQDLASGAQIVYSRS